MDVVQTRLSALNHLDYGEIGDRFGEGDPTACEEINTPGADENLFGAQHCARASTKGYVQTSSLTGHGRQFERCLSFTRLVLIMMLATTTNVDSL